MFLRLVSSGAGDDGYCLENSKNINVKTMVIKRNEAGILRKLYTDGPYLGCSASSKVAS